MKALYINRKNLMPSTDMIVTVYTEAGNIARVELCEMADAIIMKECLPHAWTMRVESVSAELRDACRV